MYGKLTNVFPMKQFWSSIQWTLEANVTLVSTLTVQWGLLSSCISLNSAILTFTKLFLSQYRGLTLLRYSKGFPLFVYVQGWEDCPRDYMYYRVPKGLGIREELEALNIVLVVTSFTFGIKLKERR